MSSPFDDSSVCKYDTDSPASNLDDLVPSTPHSIDFSSVPPTPDSVSFPSQSLPVPLTLPGLEIVETTSAGLMSPEVDFQYLLVGLKAEGKTPIQVLESLAADLLFYGNIEKVYRLTDNEEGVYGIKMDSLEAAWKVVKSPPIFAANVELLRYKLPPLPSDQVSASPSLTLYLLSAPRHILPASLRRLMEDCKLPRISHPVPVSMFRLEEEGMVIWKLTYRSQVEVDFVLRRQLTIDRKPTVLFPSPRTQTELIEQIAGLEVKVTWTTSVRDIELYEALRDRFGTLVELQPYWKQGFAIAVFQHRSVATKVIDQGTIETPGSTLSFGPVDQYYRLFGYLILKPSSSQPRRMSTCSAGSGGYWRGPRKIMRRF